MRLGCIACALLAVASCCTAASVDFAVSLNLPLFSRYGVDKQGNILIAANPNSCSLPTVNPLSPCGPIWLGKLDATGQNLVFATYLGNGDASGYTMVAGVAADASGNVIVAAHTVVQDLPTANAFQASPKSQLTSLYVAKLAPDGARLIYATYLGGSGGQGAFSLAVDRAGAAYVAGYTDSLDFPSTPQSAHEFTRNATVVAKFGADGMLAYAATFPFEFYANVRPIQVDDAGRAVLVSDVRVLTVAPDGSALMRQPLPSWAVPPPTCISNPSGDAFCPGKPWAIPLPGGGFQFIGTAGSGVPVTADALQPYMDANGYVRIEGGQATFPQIAGTVSGFAVDPKERSRIYAATAAGLFRSEDNGWNWSKLRDGPALAIAVDPFDSERLYLSQDAVSTASIPAQMYRSTDRGATWMTTDVIARVTSIAADPNITGLLYAAGGSLFRSTDGGDTWDVRAVGPSEPNSSPSAATSTSAVSVQVDPHHAGWAYVVGLTRCLGFCPVTQNLSRTQDGGKSWSTATTGLDPIVSSFVTPIISVDPNSGDVAEGLAQATAPGYRSMLFHGGDFTANQVLYPAQTTAIAFDPEHPGTIYLGVHVAKGSGSGYFVIESVDAGTTWTTLVQLDRPVYQLTVSAGGVLHGAQIPDVPVSYLVVTDGAASVQYGTYLGSAFTQIAAATRLGGKVYVGGSAPGGLPLADAIQAAPAGGTDGFLAAFDGGGALLWCTYLGGSADDSIDWVLPLPDGSVVVAGTTDSMDFPSLQASPLGTGNSFIARLRP